MTMNRIRFSLLSCMTLSGILFLGCDSLVTVPDGSVPEKATGNGERSASEEPIDSKPVTKPFNETVSQIPGTIEAENFDEGQPGVSYADQDEKNLGADDYRGATQVDIEKRDDASGGYGIGWTRKGEWLIYTVSVKETGTYQLDIPVASDKQGGTFHLEFDGEDVTGPIVIPDTGGWGTLQTISKEGLQLKKGTYAMKLVMDTEGSSGSIGDIDCLRFSAMAR